MRARRPEWSAVAPRCPICEAALEGTRSQRVIPVGGLWTEQGPEHWVVRCHNGHTADAHTLAAAVDVLSRLPRS